MTDFGKYIYSICCVSVICAIIKAISSQTGVQKAMISMLCGVCLVITVISPLMILHLRDYTDIMDDFAYSAEEISQMGYENYQTELRDSIKTHVEAYILNKAQSHAVHLQVEVTLSDDDMPIPVSVCLYGQISPYAKQRMQNMIEQDLGIKKENQQWN